MAQVVILTDFAGDRGFARYAGAYRVATELRAHGYTVQVVDHFTSLIRDSMEPMRAIIDKFVGPETLVLGLSTTFFTRVRTNNRKPGLTSYGDFTPGHPVPATDMFKLFEWAKKRAPGIRIVTGGAKAPNRETPGVHAYVMGYADTSFVDLVRFYDGKNPFLQYRKDKGALILDSDVTAAAFDFPSSSIEWHPHDLITPGEALPIEIARGCIFRCSFCSYPLNGKKKLDYLKDPDVLYREFMQNYERWGTTHYIYADDTHNDSTAKLELLYNKVYSRLPFKLNFYTYLRLDLLAAHPEQLQLLAASGLRSAFFGIESLNEKTARAVGKGMATEKVKAALHRIRNAWAPQSITTCGGFIVGLPHESEESARTWLDWLTGPDNPLDSVAINNLNLNRIREDRGLWFNDLEKNPEAYGYSFIDGTYDSWRSATGLTKERAQELAATYMARMRPQNSKVASFGIPVYLNLGVPLQDLVQRPAREYVNKERLAQRKQDLVNSYYQQLLALP